MITRVRNAFLFLADKFSANIVNPSACITAARLSGSDSPRPSPGMRWYGRPYEPMSFSNSPRKSKALTHLSAFSPQRSHFPSTPLCRISSFKVSEEKHLSQQYMPCDGYQRTPFRSRPFPTSYAAASVEIAGWGQFLIHTNATKNPRLRNAGVPLTGVFGVLHVSIEASSPLPA